MNARETVKRPAEYMRRVVFTPYRAGIGMPRFELYLLDCTYARGRDRLSYRLDMLTPPRKHPDRLDPGHATRAIVFEGDDFSPSPTHAVDGDDAVRSLMAFLTLRPGDTDADYFASYTAEQLAFARDHAEQLSAEVYARFGE